MRRLPELTHHTVQVPATTANLGAGFDAFGFAVSRHLVVRSRDRGAGVERVENAGGLTEDIPRNDDNLIWQSLVAFCTRYEVEVPDVSLVTSTAIPLERGMGSSSAAIVAGLVLARALTRVRVGDRDLVGVANDLEGHPDNVAPALLGGLVACALDDDGRVIVRRVNPATRLRPVMLVPATRQATAAARAVLPRQVPREDLAVQAGRAGHVLGALAGLWPVDVGAAGDVLHEPARRRVMPRSAAVLDGLRAAGVHGWLSGAGPSVAAVVEARDPGVDGFLDQVAAEHDFTVLAPRFDLSGTIVCPDDGCAFSGGTTCLQCPRRRL